MVQLIINGIYLPETKRDKYRCYPETLKSSLDMISGRRVWQVRGTVQKIEYSYDYMGSDLLRSLLKVLRGQAAFTVNYLADDADQLKTGVFTAESIGQPVFAFSADGTPYWHNVSFTLREVTPHD